MKIVGLIAEYNPFHNGHQYHIEKALEITDSDAAVILMSGDFVQRGAPAIMSKHLRAEAALKCGASVVLELPVCYACGSAEYFAQGAVSIFNALGCIDSICFGSECGDIEKLQQIAYIFSEEPEDFRTYLQDNLRNGMAFPAARQAALLEYTGDSSLARILELPNNTLGIEYLKAICRIGSRIRPFTLKRLESGYHDQELSQTYSSASAIRRMFTYSINSPESDQSAACSEAGSNEIFPRLEGHMPPSSFHILKENYRSHYPVCANDFSLLLKYKLLTENTESLAEYADVTLDLANRMINSRNDFLSWEQFCDLLKTKEITYTRISRMLLHILLGIRKSDMELYASSGFSEYARLLGFTSDDTKILKEIKLRSRIPLITKLASKTDLSESGVRMLDTDIFAADLYESVVTGKFNTPFINEFEKQIRIV